MQNYLIKDAQIINEGKIFHADVWIQNGLIEKIGSHLQIKEAHQEINAHGKYLLPGAIDDQVHFREPGLTHKATIYSESRAAVAGGVTSFMEMPNTSPIATTKALLEDKYDIARQSSLANYSFFMGTTNQNTDEVLGIDIENVCGIKIFMGSSTGDMLVDNHDTLDRIFRDAPTLVAIHSEDDTIVKKNAILFKEKFGNHITANVHPLIRNVEACVSCTDYAVKLALKHNTRLHILHISTEEELQYFRNDIPLSKKRITAEACVHHLYYDADDYDRLGNLIKCNPAIKERRHREAIFQALLDDRIDVIATDHAPHTWEEKSKSYWDAPSGVPLVQHSLNIMLEFYHQGKISLEKIVKKMAHAPAQLFQIEKRGFIKEGYHADLVLVDLDKTWQVNKENILYKCAWSPLEGHTFQGAVEKTWVSGHLAYDQGKINESKWGKRLHFDRK